MQLNNKKYFYIWKLSITGPAPLQNKIRFSETELSESIF